MKNKTFDIFAIVLVILTGAGFGTLIGFAYSHTLYWWVGTIVGAISGYLLAKLYLRQLKKISARGHNRKMIWLLGTLYAPGCGIICTTLIHGVMILIRDHPDESLMSQMDGFWLTILLAGELIGASAGLVVGGICSLIYVLSVQEKGNETV